VVDFNYFEHYFQMEQLLVLFFLLLHYKIT